MNDVLKNNKAIGNIKHALQYGFFIWLIPFAFSFLLFPIYQQDRQFFESIMAVTLVVVTIVFTIRYVRQTSIDSLSEGILLGVLWMLISIVIDLPIFSYSPLKMPFMTYWKEIGFMYLIIPVITSGFAMIAPKEIER